MKTHLPTKHLSGNWILHAFIVLTPLFSGQCWLLSSCGLLFPWRYNASVKLEIKSFFLWQWETLCLLLSYINLMRQTFTVSHYQPTVSLPSQPCEKPYHTKKNGTICCTPSSCCMLAVERHLAVKATNKINPNPNPKSSLLSNMLFLLY